MSLISLPQILSENFINYIVNDNSEAFYIKNDITIEILKKSLSNMLFVLPTDEGYLMLPNPNKRFCLDLRQKINWFHNKKLKKYINDFDIVIKKDFRIDLEICKSYHERGNRGSWINPNLIKLIHSISIQKDEIIQPLCFSLIDKKTGFIAASTFGFAVGGVFQDYSMMTLTQDHRSCGSILNKVVGYCLQSIGISLWYWGYQLKYMSEYKSNYNAKDINRNEFYEIFHQVKGIKLKNVNDIISNKIKINIQSEILNYTEELNNFLKSLINVVRDTEGLTRNNGIATIIILSNKEEIRSFAGSIELGLLPILINLLNESDKLIQEMICLIIINLMICKDNNMYFISTDLGLLHILINLVPKTNGLTKDYIYKIISNLLSV